MLLESLPFILAGMALSRVPVRWNAWLPACLGCGCGAGPSARSLPAAAATWLVFGPLVAGARLAAAFTVAALARSRSAHAHDAPALAQLAGILPFAAAAAAFAPLAPALIGTHPPPVAAFAGAVAATFLAAPCALGAIGLAASLKAALPPAAAGVLFVAGILDARVWLRVREPLHAHDGFGYALTALACLLVAAHGGASLVHPRIAALLWPCACVCAYLAYRHRTDRAPPLRLAPAIMMAGCVLAAPPPAYHATETTLADAFAGERVDFTGVVTRTADATTLVRYAITCCRADAAPIVIRLEKPLPNEMHGWAHARGTLVLQKNELRLRTEGVRAIAPPPDVFIYR
jgi:hypothetical protein